MHPKDRQKMCASCDGRIPFDAAICPYCTAHQAAATAQTSVKEQHHQSLQDSLTSLYPPPYAGKSTGSAFKNENLSFNKSKPPNDPMAEKRFNNPSVALGVPTIPAQSEEQQADGGKSSFFPILFLSIGANLLMLGLLQLFFSDNGFLRLEWDSSYWFAYCLAALPLFFFGFKKVNSLG